MEKTISIIVPVYNGEKSLKKCINSICTQTYKKLEIIIIDDGSEDNTFEISDGFARNDKRIKVIHQLNAGVSVARNNGLSNSTGDYIMFVDADDYLDKDACQNTLDSLISTNSDIVTANKVFHIGDRIQKNILYSEKLITREQEDKELFILDLMTTYYDPLMNKVPYLSCGVTAKLFSRGLLENNAIRFQEDCRFGEDVLFNLYAFQEAKRITYIDYDAYHFCINKDSSTHKFRNDWNISHEVFMECIDIFNEKYEKDERFLDCAKMMKVSRISSLAVSFYFHRDNPKGFYTSYKEFKNFVNSEKYSRAVREVKDYLLTDNQKKITKMIRRKLIFSFSFICYIRNYIRKV